MEEEGRSLEEVGTAQVRRPPDGVGGGEGCPDDSPDSARPWRRAPILTSAEAPGGKLPRAS